jgi:hypothetical protein
MVMAFFDSKGLIYTHIVPKGQPVNTNHIVTVLGMLLRHLRKKRPDLIAQQWWFHWENAPAHTAASVKNWIAAHKIQMLRQPAYSLDLALAAFFLFPQVKKALVGQSLDQKSLKKNIEGVTRSIATKNFATALRRWYEWCQKCIRINGNCVKNS